MSLSKIIAFVVICCSVLNPAYTQQLDPIFKPSASYSSGSVLDFEKQPDGKLLIAGDFQTFDATLQPFLVRINSNGTIDPSFSFGSGFDHHVSDILLQPDGKILVLGYFTTFNGTPAKNLIRLNADGSRDNTFSIGSGFDFAPSMIALQDDGKILATGPFVLFNGAPKKYIVRLNSDGTLDSSLDAGATDISGGVPYIVEVQDDEKIVLGGNFTSVNGTGRSGLCRLNPDGTEDNTFTASGAGPGSIISDVVVLPSGKILVGGNFTAFNGVSRKHIVRLNADGAVDNTFVASADGAVEQLEVMPDNSISVAGYFREMNSQITGTYARITEDGEVDTNFQLYKVPMVRRIVEYDGKLVLFGYGFFTDRVAFKLTRVNADGSTDVSFNQQAIFKQAGGVTTAVQSQSGKLVVGGSMVFGDGTEKLYFFRLNRDGRPDKTFNIGAGPNSTIANIVITPDDKILASGLFTSFANLGANRLIRLNADGSIDNTFAVPLSDFGVIYSLALQPDGKIIVSGSFFGSYNGTPVKNVFRLNANGTVDGSFNVGNGPNDVAVKTLVQPDGKIIVFGFFTQWNGVPARKIIRLLPNGSADPAFTAGTGFDNNVTTALLDADGKIVVGGYFGSYDGVPAPYLLKLNTNGTRDLSFDPDFPGVYNAVSALAIDKNNNILVGKFKYPYEQDFPTYLFRLTPDGDLDETFSFDGPNGSVENMMIDIDGRVIVSGAFTSVNGVPRNGMFAILPPLPTEPSNVVATLESPATVHVSWNDVSDNEAGYIIERSLESPQSFTPVDTTLANVVEFEEEVEPGATYIYRVAAVNSAGPSDFINSNAVHVETITAVEESKPRSVVIWKNSAGEYTVQTEWANGFQLAVYDLMGRQLYSEKSNTKRLDFDPQIHKHGIYIFKVVSGREVFTKKIAE